MKLRMWTPAVDFIVVSSCDDGRLKLSEVRPANGIRTLAITSVAAVNARGGGGGPPYSSVSSEVWRGRIECHSAPRGRIVIKS